VRFRTVDALTCSPDATRASVFGQASVNPAGSVEYRIDMQLAAWESWWGADRYRIRLSNGYDSGAQPIRNGDIDIHIHNAEHHHHDPDADQTRAATTKSAARGSNAKGLRRTQCGDARVSAGGATREGPVGKGSKPRASLV
jgi:hypothetical protein